MNKPFHRAVLLLVILCQANRPVLAEADHKKLYAVSEPSSQVAYGEPRKLAVLENKRITESSGLAASVREPDQFWTHNDSGGRPRLFAFDRTGKDLGRVDIEGADAVDWEDLSSFVDSEGRPSLLLADVGDNRQRRPSCRLYLITEPKLDQRSVRVRQTIRLRFEGGSQDCEAACIDPRTGTAYFVGKRLAVTCPVFELALPSADDRRIQVARRIGRLAIPLATAMDMTSDGRRAIVATYAHAFEYRRAAEESWSEAFARPPSEVIMPARRQGESICYGRDGLSLFLTSEHRPTPLWEVPQRSPR